MYTKILVPLDGSELAEQVLPRVIELANHNGAEIVLLRIPDVPVDEFLMTPTETGTAIREQAQTAARQYLDHLGNELRALGLHVETQIVRDGAVYTSILETAKTLGVDLIAMSTHGRGGLARLVMGSVADDVIHHTELPVLLVRPHRIATHLPVHYDTGYAPLSVN